uniref:RING-CH-type domain-containing protein n=1 Tax=Acrobeloides nanus TaxID=290746 RepID=A0A914CPR1_9BILA
MWFRKQNSKGIPSCRICFDENKQKDLIAPCDCNGSIKYVHSKCLKKWCDYIGSETCDICGISYAKIPTFTFQVQLKQTGTLPPYILRYWYLWLIYILASVILAVNMIYSFGFHDSWIRYKQTVVKQFEIQEPCIYWKYFIRGDAVGRRLYISMFHDVWVLTLNVKEDICFHNSNAKLNSITNAEI